MSRSIKKGPFTDPKLLKKLAKLQMVYGVIAPHVKYLNVI